MCPKRSVRQWRELDEKRINHNKHIDIDIMSSSGGWSSMGYSRRSGTSFRSDNLYRSDDVGGLYGVKTMLSSRRKPIPPRTAIWGGSTMESSSSSRQAMRSLTREFLKAGIDIETGEVLRKSKSTGKSTSSRKKKVSKFQPYRVESSGKSLKGSSKSGLRPRKGKSGTSSTRRKTAVNDSSSSLWSDRPSTAPDLFSSSSASSSSSSRSSGLRQRYMYQKPILSLVDNRPEPQRTFSSFGKTNRQRLEERRNKAAIKIQLWYRRQMIVSQFARESKLDESKSDEPECEDICDDDDYRRVTFYGHDQHDNLHLARPQSAPTNTSRGGRRNNEELDDVASPLQHWKLAGYIFDDESLTPTEDELRAAREVSKFVPKKQVKWTDSRNESLCEISQFCKFDSIHEFGETQPRKHHQTPLMRKSLLRKTSQPIIQTTMPLSTDGLSDDGPDEDGEFPIHSLVGRNTLYNSGSWKTLQQVQLQWNYTYGHFQ